jgi:hypothetical protein
MKPKFNYFLFKFLLVFIPIVSFSQINPAPVTGTTSDFLLFTASGDITNAGTTSTYLGAIGTNVGTLTGFNLLNVQPTTLYSATPETAQCAIDLNVLYSDLVSRTGIVRAGVYGSETITPGVYTTGGAVNIAADLTLNGGGDPNARFIIKTGGAFTMAAGAKILLTNGTQAKNVFWVINGAAAIAANCQARGIFVCFAGAISIGANVVLKGSTLTIAGAITTLDGMDLELATPILTNGMVLSANQTIVSGALPDDLVLTGNISPVVKWQSATNSSFTNPTNILQFTTTLSGSCLNSLINDTFFRAVLLVDGVSTFSNSVKITVASATPNLGAVGSFVLYSSGGAITNVGNTTYLSEIGAHAGAISGFPNQSDPLLHTADALTLACYNNLQGMFNTIKAYPTTNSSHSAGFGAGEVLLPGVYSIPSAATMGGTLTLDGQNNAESLFVIKITGALALAASTNMALINGATAENVLLVVDGALAIGANSNFKGTLICQAGAIAIGDGSTVEGRLFTIAGAITLSNVTFTSISTSYLPINTNILASGSQVIAYGEQPADLSISGTTLPVIQWEKSSDSIFTNPIIIPNTSLTLTGLEIGVLTATTYFRAVVSNGTTTTSSTVITVTITPITVAGNLNSSQLICIDAIPDDLLLTGNNGLVVKWQSSPTVDFLTPTDILSNTTTLSGLEIGPLSTTTYFRAVVQNCTCSVAYSNIVTILVNTLPLAGITSSDQIFCSPSEPNTLILTDNTGSVVKWQSSLTSNFTIATDITNTSSTLTGSAIGVVSSTTYFRAVTQNCNLPLMYSTTVVVTIASTTTWNGTNWSNGYPSFSNSAIFSANYTSTADMESCNLTINSGVVVTIGSGHDITLGGGLTVDPSSTFILSDLSNLLQPEGVTNTGIITVKCNSAPLYRLDYTLWSSPVTGQNLKSLSPATLTNRFYFYDSTASTNGDYAEVFNNSLFPGQTEATYNFETAKGYLIRSPNVYDTYTPPVFPSTTSAIPGVSYEGIFTGTANNGTINSSLSTALNGFNLVGNPYPSAISIEDFLDTNSATIDGTIWLWRKINSANLGVGYATLTKTGLTSVQQDVTEGISNGILGSGQAFFVKVKTGLSTANLEFNNSMRTGHNTYTFFKNNNTAVLEKHRIWLNLSNATQKISQNLIGYITGATSGVDYGLEGKNFEANAISLSSIVDNNEYNIQARSLPFDPSDVVPLNFKTNIAGNYTISIDHVDGLFETNQEVILRDNFTGNLQNLKFAAYTFNSQIGNFNTRFEIIYQTQLGVINPTFDANNFVIYKQNSILHIDSGNFIMDKIEIYDLTGRLIFTEDNVNATSKNISKLLIENQVLIVKIKTLDNVLITKKILY